MKLVNIARCFYTVNEWKYLIHAILLSAKEKPHCDHLTCKDNMISSHKLKVIVISIVLGMVILIPHTVFELLLEASHALFEVLEEGFDLLIEHIFDIGRHETQIIFFYLLLSLSIYGLYKLWRFSGRWYSELQITWTEQKINALLYWQESSLLRKIEILTIGSVTFSLLIFWYTL